MSTSSSLAQSLHTPRRWRMLFLPFAVLAMATPFIPFANDISPWMAVRRMSLDNLRPDDGLLTWLGAAFFVSFALLAWKVCRLFSPRELRWAGTVAAALAALGFVPVAVLAWSVIPGLISQIPQAIASKQYFESEWVAGNTYSGPSLFVIGLTLVPSLLIPVLGLWCAGRRWRRDRPAAIELALMTSYTSNGLFCVVMYGGGVMWGVTADLDWYLTLIAAGGMGLELLLRGFGAVKE
jgi:hypothetical protein